MWDIHSIHLLYLSESHLDYIEIAMKKEQKNIIIFFHHIEHWLLYILDVKGKPNTIELSPQHGKKCPLRLCKDNSWHQHLWNLQTELVFCWKKSMRRFDSFEKREDFADCESRTATGNETLRSKATSKHPKGIEWAKPKENSFLKKTNQQTYVCFTSF